jgi:hypothetical protein
MGLMDYVTRDGKKETDNGKLGNADIIDSLLHNKEIVTQIESPYGVFEFKYPSGSDSLKIAHRRAEYLGGYPDVSFDNNRRMQFKMWATLDVLVTKKPEKFTPLDSWSGCPDQELVETLYTRGAQFCKRIRQEITSARPKEPVIPDK